MLRRKYMRQKTLIFLPYFPPSSENPNQTLNLLPYRSQPSIINQNNICYYSYSITIYLAIFLFNITTLNFYYIHFLRPISKDGKIILLFHFLLLYLPDYLIFFTRLVSYIFLFLLLRVPIILIVVSHHLYSVKISRQSYGSGFGFLCSSSIFIILNMIGILNNPILRCRQKYEISNIVGARVIVVFDQNLCD